MTTLAELRQASLKEQKQKEQAHKEQTPEAPEAALTAPVDTALVAPPPLANGNGHHTPILALPALVAPIPVPAPVVPMPDPEAERESRFFERVHDALTHKTLHPNGAKVSADMAPALFHRAKRYCLDHGNITIRQALIDLLSAYLDEEGY